MSMRVLLAAACLVACGAGAAGAQRYTCPPPRWSITQLDRLKQERFALPDAFERHELAVALTACLGHPNPSVRDGIAYEALTTWMRSEQLDQPTLVAIRTQLLAAVSRDDAEGFAAPFAALVLAEVARTDRIKPWMSDADRDTLVRAAALYLARITDYRAFSDADGFRHGVAHGADLVLQLALNPAVTKPQLDHLMLPIAAQVAPPLNLAYWAGEPERLARPILYIAQRNLHADAEWRAFFSEVTDATPLASWQAAFSSELGLKKRHNVRAFLVSVYAGASSSEDAAIRRLIPHVTAALKAVP
jgi:hypothetical protein